jgi:hypothetical protein
MMKMMMIEAAFEMWSIYASNAELNNYDNCSL